MDVKLAIDQINFLKKSHQGSARFSNRDGKGEIERSDNGYLFRVDERLGVNIDDLEIDFCIGNIRLHVVGLVSSTSTSIDTVEKQFIQYSEGRITSFSNHLWVDELSYFQSFYLSTQRHLVYHLCGMHTGIILSLCSHRFKIYDKQDYLVIECMEKIPYQLFSDLSYNLLVAIGFVTGEFIQDEVFTFQYDALDTGNENTLGIRYRRLRSSFSSIYCAIASDPYSHSHKLDEETVRMLDENGTLKHVSGTSISKLTELSFRKKQIQYALVLFNEANGGKQSLLIKNNCFFAVLEVLKKYFYDFFKAELPQNYSSEGNIKKYALLFQRVIPISEDELQTIEKRNVFLHGDIEEISGEEMVAVMQKQITLIYKLLLTHVGFDGHIIDHYAIGRQPSVKPFIKLGE